VTWLVYDVSDDSKHSRTKEVNNMETDLQKQLKETIEQQEKPKVVKPKATTTKPKPKAEVKPATPKAPTGKRPEELAKELKVTGKQLRAWLRKNHTRDEKQKNTAWYLDAKTVASARKAFATKKSAK